MYELEAFLWPTSRLGEALETLTRTSGLSPQAVEVPTPPAGRTEASEAMEQWLETIASRIDLDAEPAEVPYPEVAQFLSRTGPALLCLPGAREPRWLVLCRGGRRLAVHGPSRTVHHLRPDAVRWALCQGLEAPHIAGIEAVLDAARVPARRRARAQAAMLRQQLGTVCIADC